MRTFLRKQDATVEVHSLKSFNIFVLNTIAAADGECLEISKTTEV